MTPPTLTTERLSMVPLAERHFSALRAFYASDRSSFVGGPKDADEAWRALAMEAGHWALRGYGRWAVEHDGEMVALVGGWNPEGWPEPEIGWDVMNGHEGKGYATEAALAARAWLYGEAGWTTAISLIADGNMGSEGVAKRVGATHESHFAHAMFGPMSIWRHPGRAA